MPGGQCGACCTDGGDCTTVFEWDCDEVWWAACEDCQDYDCPDDPWGACCNCGNCTQTVWASCNGIWFPGVPCDNSTCADVNIYGACCYHTGVNNHCDINHYITPAGVNTCQDAGGTFMGCNVGCNDNLCKGACCGLNPTPDYCSFEYGDVCESDCGNECGWWGGIGTDCWSDGYFCWGSCCLGWGTECCPWSDNPDEGYLYGCGCFTTHYGGGVAECENYDSGDSFDYSWMLRKQCNHMGIPSQFSVCGAPCPAEPSGGEPFTCPQECTDAGCECLCMETENGIVCLD